jgi:hypothetical protein
MRGCARFLLAASLVFETVAVAQAGERAVPENPVPSTNPVRSPGQRTVKDEQSSSRTALDRIAYAVDGAESSHGADPAMWGSDPSGPQGPMQVTEAAAADVGGGDRYDLIRNRALGREYLALLFRRYQNWPDAIVAYNWGMGKLDAWIKAGRPADKFLVGVASYLWRVLHDSGMCDRPVRVAVRQRAPLAAEGELDAARAACGNLDAWGGLAVGADHRFLAAPNRFRSRLDRAALLAAQHLPALHRLVP